MCLEAVREDRGALKYVDKSIFEKGFIELTVEEISNLLGYDIKVVK